MISRNIKPFLLLVLLITSWGSLVKANDGLIGTWSGTDSDGDSATFVFNADSSAEVKFEGVPRLSTQTMTNGKVSWSIDTTLDPMPVDVIIVRDATEVSRIRMLAQRVDEQTLKIQISRDMTTRPAGFEMTDKVFQLLATKQ